MRKTFYGAAIVAAAIAIAALTAANSSGSSDDESARTIKLFAPTVQFALIDLGTQGVSLGDQFVSPTTS